MSENEENSLSLPIEWSVPDDIVTRFVTNMVVQHSDAEFVVSFFEVQPPIFIGSAEDRREKLSQLKSIKAKCVARIVVTPDRMEEFVRVLTGNLEGYKEAKKRESAEQRV